MYSDSSSFGDPVPIIVPLESVVTVQVGPEDWIRIEQRTPAGDYAAPTCSTTSVAAATGPSVVAIKPRVGTYAVQVVSADNQRLLNISITVAAPLEIDTTYVGHGSRYAVTQQMKRAVEL
ncbi:MAG: hypothetical protein R2706_19620 [Acidimicrobiales bacterium]